MTIYIYLEGIIYYFALDYNWKKGFNNYKERFIMEK